MKELVITTSSYAPSDIPDLGNRFLVGNGYMGVRGTLEEYGVQQLTAVNLAGIYDRFGDGWREPLNAPNPFFLQLYENGSLLALPDSTVTAHTQALNARQGIHHRDTTFSSGTRLQAERFAHMEHVHMLCMKATVEAKAPGNYQLTCAIDGDVWDIHGPHYRLMTTTLQDGMLTASGVTNEDDTVSVCAKHALTIPNVRTDTSKGRTQTAAFAFSLEAGESATLTMVAAVYTSQDTLNPLATAIAQVSNAKGYAQLKQEHIACWQQLWARANVEIDGDDAGEQALNYSIYHLLSIAPRHANSLSVPARGLSGQIYKGAIFWDTEMFMLDFYLAVLPDVAKTLLRYRIDTLPGAKEKARQYGYRGAFYAWESQEGGFDACSDYNVTDVFTGRPMRTYFKDKQIHITAAVIYGLWKYARWTGDNTLWLEGGAEVLIEAARFYHSRLTKSVEKDVYELQDVIGPDEYHERIDNNAYTNEMARFVFEQTAKVTSWIKASHPVAYAALDSKLSFTNELPAFAKAALLLKEQRPNHAGIIQQFDGYFQLEHASIDEVRSRLKDPREYWGGAYGVASDTQVIKQADVITQLFMLRHKYDEATIRTNYEYYLPRTEHGSSLSACMYALAACAIHQPEDAYPLFLKSAQADLAGGGKQWAGLVYIGGTHPAAAGGAYMTFLWGFLGLNTSKDGYSLSPRLPKGWHGAKCNIHFRGQNLQLTAGTLGGIAP